jgi:hypothetical protein
MVSDLIVFVAVSLAACYLAWKYSPARLKLVLADAMLERGPAGLRASAGRLRARLATKSSCAGCDNCPGCPEPKTDAPASVTEARASRVIPIRHDATGTQR